MRVIPFFLGSLLLTAASIDQGGVQNAAPWNNGQGLIAPGQIIMVKGSGFVPFGTEASFKSFPVPTNLAGVQVRFDNVAGAIYYASPNQINVQVPYTVITGTNVTMTILNNGSVVAVTTAKTTAQQPGLFTFGAEPIVTDLMGNLVGTTGRDPIVVGQTGAYITLWGSGFGLTNWSPFPGQAAPGAPNLAHLVTGIKSARLDGRELNILYAGLTPGSVGLYQLNIELPAGTPAGVHKLSLNIGGVDIPEFQIVTR